MFKSAFLLGLVSSLAAAQQMSLTSILQGQDDLSTLLNLLNKNPSIVTALQNANSPWTILAPTNQAFSTLLDSNPAIAMAAKMNNSATVASLLQYHVLNGSYPSTALPNGTATYVESFYKPASLDGTGQHVGARLNGSEAFFFSGDLQTSTTTQVDIAAGRDNYYIHKIDTVLTLPRNVTDTIDVLPNYESNFTAFAGAVNKANLAQPINSADNITLFVPNNAAFAEIGNITRNLTTNMLQSILQYHVVRGAVLFSEDITNTTVKSLQGANVQLQSGSGGVFVNGAKVVMPNIIIANGVAHVINEVLNPMKAPTGGQPTATPSPNFPNAGPNSDGGDSLPGNAPPKTSSVSVDNNAMNPTSTKSGAAVPAMTQPAMFGAAGMAAAAYFLI